MAQVLNFSSDPAILPAEVLKQAQQELRDWNGLGTSVMKVNHRGKGFIQAAGETEKDFRDLLDVPSNCEALFYHGGGRGQFAAIPLDIPGDKTIADYVGTGYWAVSVIKGAERYYTPNISDVRVTVDGLRAVKLMHEQQLSDNAAYMHYCPNETIDGAVIDETLDFGKDVMVIVDFFSTILSRPTDVSRYGVIHTGVQKSIGPADLTVVIVREDLLDRANIACPSILDYSILNNSDSMFNTPLTFAWYLSSLVFKWLKTDDDVAEMDKINQQRVELLYGVIGSSDFYHNDMVEANRSRVNAPFQLVDSVLDKLFLEESFAADPHALKGYHVVDGMHASIYNATPLESTKTPTDFMVELKRRHG